MRLRFFTRFHRKCKTRKRIIYISVDKPLFPLYSIEVDHFTGR